MGIKVKRYTTTTNFKRTHLSKLRNSSTAHKKPSSDHEESMHASNESSSSNHNSRILPTLNVSPDVALSRNRKHVTQMPSPVVKLIDPEQERRIKE